MLFTKEHPLALLCWLALPPAIPLMVSVCKEDDVEKIGETLSKNRSAFLFLYPTFMCGLDAVSNVFALALYPAKRSSPREKWFFFPISMRTTKNNGRKLPLYRGLKPSNLRRHSPDPKILATISIVTTSLPLTSICFRRIPPSSHE